MSSDSASDEKTTVKGFFYIVQTPDVEPNVYKIGKTVQSDPNKRLCAYPKYSAVKYTIAVNDADGFEDYAMRKFRTLFIRRLEYGLEYYQGNLTSMIDTAHRLYLQCGAADKIILDKRVEQIKPHGWQAFCNEWLSEQHLDPAIPITEEFALLAYEHYCDLLTTTYASEEYAAYPVFKYYLQHCFK